MIYIHLAKEVIDSGTISRWPTIWTACNRRMVDKYFAKEPENANCEECMQSDYYQQRIAQKTAKRLLKSSPNENDK
jgi:hypothetical protein